MDKDCLRTGDKATVHFHFIKTPEYLHIDQRLVFREGRTKAVGTITKPALDEESHNQEGNKAKGGGSSQRHGGQRHKVKSQAAIVTPAGGC